MKKTIVHILLCLLPGLTFSQSPIKINPYVQQFGSYYSSDHINHSGIGFGGGIALSYGKHFISQADVNLLWINGNAVSTRIAAGIKKGGKWSPALLANITGMWGSRTEVLFENGDRPAIPAASIGFRFVPLRFENQRGFVSLFEFGLGFGAYQGIGYESSLLCVGISF